jgi:hypothetical protein
LIQASSFRPSPEEIGQFFVVVDSVDFLYCLISNIKECKKLNPGKLGKAAKRSQHEFLP